MIDAGMRQLWQTGWMHNRIRMIVGSLLVKHLLHSWTHGEEWFWDTLVDALSLIHIRGVSSDKNGMTTLRLILGDQLNEQISSLSDCDKDNEIILMCEVWDEATYVKHHKKKIAFIFSAMRHFSQELKDSGYNVDYIKLRDDTKSFKDEVSKAIKCHNVTQIIVTEPSEYRVLDDMKTWADDLDVTVDIRPDDRFIATHDEFAEWAKGRKELRMEYSILVISIPFITP